MVLGFYQSLLDTETDKVKFEQIYYKYRKMVKFIAREITEDDALAEDAAQEIFIKITKYMSKFQEVESSRTKTLISLIAKCAAKDFMEKERRYQVISFEELHSQRAPEKSDFTESELYEKICTCPKMYSEPFLLRYYYNFSVGEIADILCVNVAGVRKRIERARRYLAVNIKSKE